MRIRAVLLFLILFTASHANEWLGKTVPQLVLADGKTYTGVTFTKIEPDAVTISHAGGIARVPMESLQVSAQEALGYDPEKAAAARKAAREAADSQVLQGMMIELTSEPAIPGIAAVDLHGNLTKKGFELTKNLGGIQAEWTCRLEAGLLNYDAQALGRGPGEITLVKASVSGVSTRGIDQDAADFLGFIASLPYDGSDPAAARAWVAGNVHRNAETVIGGVKFQIFANAPHARLLRISVAR